MSFLDLDNINPQHRAGNIIMSQGGAADPFFANVILFLQGNGADGAQVFPDISPLANIVAANGGGVTTSNLQSLWFPTSIRFVPNSFLLTTIGGGLGAGDFTIEYWHYLNTQVGNQMEFNSRTGGGAQDGVDISGSGEWSTAGNSFGGGQAGNFNAGVWEHIVRERLGDRYYCFTNGVMNNDSGAEPIYDFTPGQDFRIGGSPYGNVGYMDGFITDLRITRGVARYSPAGFTPPTGPFPTF